MTHPHLPFYLAAVHTGMNPHKILQALNHFDTMQTFFSATTQELLHANLSVADAQKIKQVNWRLVEKDLAWASHANHHLLTLADDTYPSLLKEINDPPLVLYVMGDPKNLSAKQMAMVGSRHASCTGLELAKEFAIALCQAGFAITSGLALGIDGASHEGALSAGGITIGVAGTGLQHVYPPSHRTLVEKILSNHGVIISEFALHTPPRAINFPRRNRIVSGLAVGVLIVEAALKSGSLITARHASEQGREVFAIPGCIKQPFARGCHYLIRQGAKLVENVDDILEEFDFHSKPKVATNAVKLTNPCQQVLHHISYETTPLDVILLRSRLTASELSSILLTLELHGYIQTVPGGYSRTTNK